MWRAHTRSFSGSDVRRRTALKLSVAAAAAGLAGLHAARGAGRAPVRARVIVIGGGFAGATCARQLRQLQPALEVELIDPDDVYVTCPMSNAALVGLRTIDSLTVSRSGLERHGVRVIRDRVAAIDTGRRQVRLSRGSARSYDRLVFAAGIRFLWDRPAGYTQAVSTAMPHAWQAGEQTRILRRRWRHFVPEASSSSACRRGPCAARPVRSSARA